MADLGKSGPKGRWVFDRNASDIRGNNLQDPGCRSHRAMIAAVVEAFSRVQGEVRRDTSWRTVPTSCAHGQGICMGGGCEGLLPRTVNPLGIRS